MLLLVPVAAWAAAGWSPQVATPAVTADLAAVDFSDSSDGWAVGAAGTILHTTDGGATWTAQAATPATTQSLAGVAFADSERRPGPWAPPHHSCTPPTAAPPGPRRPRPRHHPESRGSSLRQRKTTGWAVGAAGTILHTTDGGATWSADRDSRHHHDLASVAFANANDGWPWAPPAPSCTPPTAGATWTAPDRAVPTTHDLDLRGLRQRKRRACAGAAGNHPCTPPGAAPPGPRRPRLPSPPATSRSGLRRLERRLGSGRRRHHPAHDERGRGSGAHSPRERAPISRA